MKKTMKNVELNGTTVVHGITAVTQYSGGESDYDATYTVSLVKNANTDTEVETIICEQHHYVPYSEAGQVINLPISTKDVGKSYSDMVCGRMFDYLVSKDLIKGV